MTADAELDRLIAQPTTYICYKCGYVGTEGPHHEDCGYMATVCGGMLPTLARELKDARAGIAAALDMIANCGGIPSEPDSLVRMLEAHLRTLQAEEPTT